MANEEEELAFRRQLVLVLAEARVRAAAVGGIWGQPEEVARFVTQTAELILAGET